MHRHHIIPLHSGGTDTEENLTPLISVALHAEFHRWLWLDGGKKEDYIAWKCLSGRIHTEDKRIAAAKIGQKNSELYKNTRKQLGVNLAKSGTKETRSKGGKTASKALLKWQKENKEKHSKQCSENGKLNSQKIKKKCVYLGVLYNSKKELQEKFGLSICGFYGKLKRGEIKYV